MTQEFNLDALLEGTLDDLKDLPEFKPFPAGVHKVTVTSEQKKVNNKPCLEIKLKLVEVVELSNSEDTPPEAGAEANVLLQLDNEFGQGMLKKILTAVALKFGAKKNSELLVDLQNLECLVATNIRENKDKTAKYLSIVEFMVP
jgi:hypothetical protein